MSPMSPSRRAAPDGPIPLSSRSELPVAATSWRSCLSAARILASMTVSSSMSSRASWWRVWATMPTGCRRGAQQVAGLAAGEELLRSAGDQLEQQLVDAADDLGAGPAQLVAAVHQQPQRDGDVVGHDLAQAWAAQAGHGHAVRVDRVGLAALAGVEDPHPGRQLRPARRGRSRRRRPGAGRCAGRSRRSPRPPTPGPGTGGRPPASAGSRRCRCRTGPAPAPARVRR